MLYPTHLACYPIWDILLKKDQMIPYDTKYHNWILNNMYSTYQF